MKEQPHSTIGISKIRRVPYRITKKLEADYKVNERSIEEYKEVVWQEKTKFLRVKGWKKHVVGEQEYPIKLTLKEVGLKKIWTF